MCVCLKLKVDGFSTLSVLPSVLCAARAPLKHSALASAWRARGPTLNRTALGAQRHRPRTPPTPLRIRNYYSRDMMLIGF